MKKSIKNLKRKFAIGLSVLAVVMCSVVSASADTESSDPGLFDAEHISSVTCSSTLWHSTYYHNATGAIVGTTTTGPGKVNVTFTGAYASTTEGSGGVAAHNMSVCQCYGSSTSWCSTITAVEACQ